MAPYWNVMFDDAKAGRDATSEDESKGVTNADHNSEVTPSSEPKGKVKKGYHTCVGALPSSPQPTFEFVSKRQLKGFSVMMDVQFRKIVETLKDKWHGRMKLVIELERHRGDAFGKSFDKPPTLDKSIGSWKIKTRRSASIAPILRKVSTVNLYNLEPLLGKGMQHKWKGMQLVHPFTPLESYKRRKVGDGCSTEDFVVDLDPIRIIPKPDVEVFIDVLTHWWVGLGKFTFNRHSDN
ncbi:unnamed protein product [Malus baccata var. baccata]